jgi:hypothetical protein
LKKNFVVDKVRSVSASDPLAMEAASLEQQWHYLSVAVFAAFLCFLSIAVHFPTKPVWIAAIMVGVSIELRLRADDSYSLPLSL